jgi:hypothetical protein
MTKLNEYRQDLLPCVCTTIKGVVDMIVSYSYLEWRGRRRNRKNWNTGIAVTRFQSNVWERRHFQVENVATSRNLAFKITMFPHRNVHIYTRTFSDGKTDRSRIDRLQIAFTFPYARYFREFVTPVTVWW